MASTFSPSLKNWNVGMHRTAAPLATSLALSTSTLRKATSPYLSDSSAYRGATRLHGPHHDAVKSTTVSRFAFFASSSFVLNASASVTSTTAARRAGPASALGASALRMIPLMVRVMRNETRIRTWLGTVCQYAEMVAQGSARNESRAFMMGA